METLHPTEVRVLGCLLEKDLTTPEYYPLTLNALINACNQKSSRHPVVHYDEAAVMEALALLREKNLVTRLSGAGHRVEKFGHRLGDLFNLGRREMALLCVLMLRGPQTVGELRGRTERMHSFSDLAEVEHVLDSLASAEPDPFVAPMARGRWTHLWSGMPEEDAVEAISMATSHGAPSTSALEARVEALEQELAELRERLDRFEQQFQ